MGLLESQRLVLGSWHSTEIDGLEAVFGRPAMPLTGVVSAGPVGESRDSPENAPFDGLDDLNVDMSLAGEAGGPAAASPGRSDGPDLALDQALEEVVDELAAEGDCALAEDAEEEEKRWALAELRATHAIWLKMMDEIAGPPPQFNY